MIMMMMMIVHGMYYAYADESKTRHTYGNMMGNEIFPLPTTTHSLTHTTTTTTTCQSKITTTTTTTLDSDKLY